MTHVQLFKRADNAEGFISCIVLRERYLEEFKALGFVETQAEAVAQEIDTPAKRGPGRPRKEDTE